TTTVAYGGAQDNGTIGTASLTYGDLLGGDGGYVAVDPQTSSIVYCESQEGKNITQVDLNTGNRTSIMDGIPATTDAAAWAAPIAIDPQTEGVLWHVRHYIYTTLQGGDPWFRVSDQAVFNGLGSAIGISPANTGVVYVGSDRGELQITTDNGESWTNQSHASGLPNRAITDLAASNTDPATAYMGVSGFYTSHVYKTTDYGASWKSISSGLPDIPVNALAIHPDDEKIIYAGTDIGMFITTDGGETWATYNQGLPRVAVADLEIHKKANTLVMASHGRSMWEISLEKPSVQPSITSPAGGEIWMAGTGQLISWSGFNPGPVIIEFSLDNGSHWQKLKDNVTGNTFRWNIFDTAVSYARLRVTSMGTAGQVATSRSFTITNYAIGGLLNTTGVTATPYGIAFDGEYLWSTDWGSKTLLKLDPNTLQTVAVLTMDLPKGLDSLFTDLAYVPTKGHFFINKLNNTVQTNPGGVIIEIDKAGKLVGQWTSPCAYPIGVAWLGGNHSTRQQLLITDRNRDQKLYFYNPDDMNNPVEIKDRLQPHVQYGPRGATEGPDGKTFYQAITDFSGGALQTTTAEKRNIETQSLDCTIPLSSPFVASGVINARGIEFDPRDSNIWVSDFGGNIYKMVSCDSRASIPPPPQADAPSAPATGGMTLAQNSPNPFSGTTSIRFTLPGTGNAKVVVYDATGKLVATVADGRFDAGEHVVEFTPNGLPSGVYRYSLVLENGATRSGTMVYLK
ncbi:MAG: T9SS type A sorting domain-containing protein, partial [Candidatus Kapaibacterium sp.]